MLRHDLNTKGRDGRLAPWRRGRFTRSNELNSVSQEEIYRSSEKSKPCGEAEGVCASEWPKVSVGVQMGSL